MEREDLHHPAWTCFLQFAQTHPMPHGISPAWACYKAGFEISLELVAGKAEEKEEEQTLEFSQEEDEEEPKQFVQTHAGIMPKTCARCPNPRSPSPEFHTTGIAHTPIPSGMHGYRKATPQFHEAEELDEPD